jgi:hypothetical protein
VSPPTREKPALADRLSHIDCNVNAKCNPSGRHITVRGPGRCTECSFHVATQGHRDGCSGTAPVQSDERALNDSRAYYERALAERAARTTGSTGYATGTRREHRI